MFGHDSLPSKIYSYGALEPLRMEAVLEQFQRAHRYRNALIALELLRRREVDDCLRAHYPGLPELREAWMTAEERLEVAEEEAKRANIRAGSKEPGKEMKAALRQARCQRRAARRAYQDAKRPAYADPVVREQLALVEAEDLERRKKAREESGLYWGNYLMIEQAASAYRKGRPPRFRSWAREKKGKLAVQIQKGMTVKELLDCDDMRLRLAIAPATSNSRRAREKPRAVVSFRVGSDGRQPVFAEIPIRYHRPLPESCQIKWAYLIREKVAAHWQWRLQFVVAQTGGFPRRDKATDGIVGIDVGWRRLRQGGLRVAYAVGSDDHEEELVLPEKEIQGRWLKIETIRSERDRAFNEARQRLAGYLAVNDIPDWLMQDCRYIAQWRSPGHLAVVALRWQGRWVRPDGSDRLDAHRFKGDAEIVEFLEHWRQCDKASWEEEANLRQKAIAWRDEQYRLFAVRLCRRYHLAALEKIDWRELTETPEVGEDEAASPRWRFIAAPGRLQEILKEAFADWLPVDPAYTTMRCNACERAGHRHLWSEDEDYDAAAKLHHICGHCAKREDQDRNAALNLLDAASGEAVDENPISARSL